MQHHAVVSRDVGPVHAARREVLHELVEVAIHRELNRTAREAHLSRHIDPVVRRKPRRADRVPRQDDHSGETRDRDPSAREIEKRRGRDREPDRRGGSHRRDDRHHDHAGQRADQIRRVRRQRRQLPEKRADDRSGAQEDPDDQREQKQHEDDAADEHAGVRQRLAAPQNEREVGEAQPYDVKLLGESEEKRDQEERGERPVLDLRAPRPERHAQAHAEEGGHEGEVVEVGKDANLLRSPADQSQLQHQDAEGRKCDLQGDGTLHSESIDLLSTAPHLPPAIDMIPPCTC